MTGSPDRGQDDGTWYPYQQQPHQEPSGAYGQGYAQDGQPYGRDGRQGYYQQQPYQPEQPAHDASAGYGQGYSRGQQQPAYQDPSQQYGQGQHQGGQQYGGQQYGQGGRGGQQGYYQQPYQPEQPVYDPSGGYGQGYAHEQQLYAQDPYAAGPAPAQRQAQPVQQAAPPAPPRPRPAPPTPAAAPPAEPAQPSEQVGGRRTPRAPKDDYSTGEFTFVDEQAEESEDVIDWLKFAESRSEVRAERRRRLRNRLVALLVVLAVLSGGAVGYLWWAGKLGGGEDAAAVAGDRQVNVVHLRDLQGKVSTALLVNDAAGHKGSVLMLPDTLKVPGGDAGTVTVGQGLDTIGASATREGLSTVLGAPVGGTWRLDTPYLELLVAQLGGVKVDTDVEVREGNKPDGKVLAAAGKGVTLTGKASVAYATYQAPTEGRDAQLARFGKVLEAVVRTMPTDLAESTDDVHRMNAVLDPSLAEKQLGGVLALLAGQARDGHLTGSTLKVKPDGTLDEATAGQQVKEILGGTVKAGAVTAGGTATRVSFVNASGNDQNATTAGIQAVNAGLELVPSTAKTAAQATTEIRYTDDSRAADAKALAGALGLPETAVKKASEAQNADLVVVLGKDYQPPKAP
ncbi:LytR C-terminal domain-containing protein [Kitasatospora sp. NPDC088346]|uniref:LytR C-terminal domain-containing protein n=1 Tax=Kitasatospora sp. NPDC088346 TaxID=3364073 RepID=UPI0038058BCB